ncbi:MAG: hypothetical protein NC218_00650 [Acetobacter sp.]|nr:hypothetical protein [Acetobacter sp.]
MKLRYTILIIIAILTSAAVFSFLLNSCSEEKPTAQEIIEFNNDHYKWTLNYRFEKTNLEELQKANFLRKKTANNWKIYKDTTRNIVEKKQIVRILRMASSSVINSPSFYTKNYSENSITEKGHGAENEDFIVFYLSDGQIIKSSPQINPEWMGTMVGEKVLKTTGKRLIANEYEKITYHNVQNNSYETVKTAPDFHFEEYTTYQPLYSK